MPDPIIPSELTLQTIKTWRPKPRSEARTGGLDDYAINRKLFDGDHWLDGKGWVGPMPGDNDDDDFRTEARERIRLAFCSQNVVREVVERHAGGVAGHPPQVGLVADETDDEDKPETESEEDEQDDASKMMTASLMEWWATRKGHSLLHHVVETVLLGETASARIWIPEGLLSSGVDEDGDEEGETVRTIPEGLTYLDALNLIHLSTEDPTDGFLHRDPLTQRAYAVFMFEVDKKVRAEVSYVDDEGMTAQVVVTEDGATEYDPVDLGGRLFLDTITRALFVTPQIRQQQMLLNKALTMMSVNLDWSGFLERIFLNAQEPTEQVPDPDRPGETKLVPAPYRGGANRATFAVGVTTEDADGNETVARPEVVFRQPTEATVFTSTKREAYESALHEARQLHALISGDARASGESRIQALADFIVSLLYTKVVLDGLGNNILSAVHAYALAISGESDRGLRVTFSSRIDAGPVPAEMMRAVIERVKARLLSPESAMSMLGTPDVVAELDRIGGRMSLDDRKTIAETVRLYLDAGASLLEAATLAGATSADIKSLEALANRPTDA